MAESPSRIPRALVEPTLRLVCLRFTLILIPVFAFLYFHRYRFEYCNDANIEDLPKCLMKITLAIALSLMFLHHSGSALGPRLVPLYTWVDLLLNTVEFGYCIFLAVAVWDAHLISTGPGLLLSLWALTILLGSLLLLKVLHVSATRGSTLFRRANILSSRHGITHSGPTAGNATLAPWNHIVRVILGVRLWKRVLPGEGRWIAVLRGLLALSAIIALLGFGIIMILLGPLAEIGLTPTREYRVVPTQFDESVPVSSKPMAWRVIIERIAPGNIREEAAVVVPLDHDNTCGITEQSLPNGNSTVQGIQLIVFDCYGGNLSKFPKGNMGFPDLFLRVNFSDLESESGDTIGREWLRVYVAFTANTQDALAMTRPIYLFPGTNLIGLVNLEIRRRFRAPELSIFGLFDVYDTFAIADTTTVSMSGMETHPSVSTLRLSYQGPAGEWRVVQDYRERSILSGLSAAGGLGSFLSLVCAVVFGTSLYSVLFREKPVSLFGVLHNLEREELAIVCKSKYPKLEAELRALETEENRGVLALLLDTLLDLDLIKEQVMKPQSSAPPEGEGDGDHTREDDIHTEACGPVLPISGRDFEQDN